MSDQRKELITLLSEINQGGGAGWPGKSIENFVTKSDSSLRKYVGWYHTYSYSFGWPNWIIRSLVNLYEHQGRVLSKTIERLRGPVHGGRFKTVFPYQMCRQT
ncbi:hypothetical protein LCGC14_2747290 [marine sediment metagenome]|uniref:Uncharacterized protein n=1 Tax=marine sediment metagenome TaxID=412755 RepID=A0A0F9BUH0_9ZZZZ